MLHGDGKLQAALDHVELLVVARTPAGAKEPVGVAPALLLHRAHLLDALGRIEPALEAYARARKTATDAATRCSTSTCVALLENDRDAGTPKTAGGRRTRGQRDDGGRGRRRAAVEPLRRGLQHEHELRRGLGRRA